MRRISSAVSNSLIWLTVCGFTALLVVTAEAEDAFRLQDVGIPSASDYQGVALGDATDDIYLYLSRDKQQGQLYRWKSRRAVMVDLADLERPGSEAGAGWADYGSDGDLDLFVSRVGLPDLLYVNDNGEFSERANLLGVDDSGSGQGVSWVDYDQDGYVDLYVARFGQPNLLYAGQVGSEPFVEKATEVGLDDPGPSTGGAWGDFDADGDLDLYVVDHKRADHLYRQVDGAFEGSNLAGDDGAGVGATWVDWDNDGDLDLSLARYGEPDRLLQNEGPEGGFRFTDIAPQVRLDDRGQGQMVAWGDYDLDGDPDAYVVNGGEARDVSRLYHNDHGSFSNASIKTGLIDPTRGAARLGKAAIWWDHDGDGDLDLLTLASGEGTGLFENDGLSGRNSWLKVRVRNKDPGDLNWFPGSVIVHSGGRVTVLSMSAPTSYLNQGSQVSVVGLGRDRVGSVEVNGSGEARSIHHPKPRDILTLSPKQIEPETHRDISRAVLPTEVHFTEVSTGTRATELVYVINNSDTIIHLEGHEFRPDPKRFELVNEFPTDLKPGETDSLTVRFSSPIEETVTADLVLRASSDLPTVRLIGQSRRGRVVVSPDIVRLAPGEQERVYIENQWLDAVTEVCIPPLYNIHIEWEAGTELAAGERKTAFITALEGARSASDGRKLTVEYRQPDGNPNTAIRYFSIRSEPDAGTDAWRDISLLASIAGIGLGGVGWVVAHDALGEANSKIRGSAVQERAVKYRRRAREARTDMLISGTSLLLGGVLGGIEIWLWRQAEDHGSDLQPAQGYQQLSVVPGNGQSILVRFTRSW
jgi:enediyne biosynthesis protein E4